MIQDSAQWFQGLSRAEYLAQVPVNFHVKKSPAKLGTDTKRSHPCHSKRHILGCADDR
jgi:hypothetical protein